MTRTLAKPLNAHQQRFVDAYMEHRVASRAAIQAGFGSSSAGSLMAACRDEINRRLALCRKRAEITEARIAEELAQVGYADPADLFDEEGRLLPVRKMPEAIRRALASIEVEASEGKDGEPTTTTKLKFWGKVQALEAMAKYKGMFVERHEVRGSVTYVIQAPMPATNSVEWAKQVQSAVVREDKERP